MKDLSSYKEALAISRTGEDRNGAKYTDIGRLNQAAWIGENSGSLINEIERLESDNAALRERVKELEKDKARLDWFQGSTESIQWDDNGYFFGYFKGNPVTGNSPREVIDRIKEMEAK